MTTDDYKVLVPPGAEEFALIAFDTREPYWSATRMFDGNFILELGEHWVYQGEGE